MERRNKFKIVIPSYNNEKWVEPNVASIINQTYKNYEVLYINDASTDNTPNLVQKIIDDYNLNNWKLLNWETNKQRGYNVNPNSPHIIDFMDGKDEDILMFVDGDDWLIDENVLENLNNFYNTNHCWMAYGGMYTYPSSNKAYPQNTSYSSYVHENKLYRKDAWRASHLRSFKWFLYKNIKKEDLIYSKTGEYYYNAEDLAVSFYCLEMCPPHKIGVLDFPSYAYNESPEIVQRGLQRQNNDISDPNGQEAEIRSKTPYPTLQYHKEIDNNLIVKLGGGLGNMLFQVASSLGLSKTFDYNLFSDYSHFGILHTSPTSYKSTFLKKLPQISVNLSNVEVIEENDFCYQELSLPDSKNIALKGAFQSYKYFDKYRQDIIDFFSYKDYNPKMGFVSIHVRRGNYTQLQNYHYLLDKNYYLNAIDYFPNYKFLVFSDDIEWCKQVFQGDKFTFIENQTDTDDLWLMSECEHNIIGNSTFSWWGAYLNRNPNKIVIHPEKWFGPLNSNLSIKDMFPPEWVCLTENVPEITINLFDKAYGHLSKPNGRYSSVHGKVSKHCRFTRNNLNFEGINLFTDEFLITQETTQILGQKIGWLLETREVCPERYEKFSSYKDKFDYVLTHDEKLLKEYPDNTKFIPFGGCWVKDSNFDLHSKSKHISMIYSNKTLFEGHKLRHQVAKEIEGIDLFGRGTSRPLEYKEEALNDYHYTIVIENSSCKNYFTEKLIDAFATGTIPIYWGCPNIEEFFNIEGIITFKNLKELKSILPTLTKELYTSKIEILKENLERSKDYNITEDWIYKNIIHE